MKLKNKIAIMQPYLFPYIGYFQLINAVDFFGIGDDVQYIKSGWINRNRIYYNDKIETYSFSLKKDSSSKLIKERFYHDSFKLEQDKFLRILEIYYNKAPYYIDIIKLIKKIFEYNELNVSLFNKNQLSIICNYLNIHTEIIDSSFWEIENPENMEFEERTKKKLEKLNKKIGVNHFINPIGGSKLYDKKTFSNFDYKLSFLNSSEVIYNQNNNKFVSNLSIIDVMMYNSVDEISEMLSELKLV